MSPMIKILKKQGIKAALPLLLLATACGEGNSPSASSDDIEAPSSGGAAVTEVSAEMPDMGDVDGSSLLDPAVVPSTDDKEDTDVMAAAKSAAFPDTSTKVPEPATLTGLAVVALGFGAVKRRRSA